MKKNKHLVIATEEKKEITSAEAVSEFQKKLVLKALKSFNLHSRHLNKFTGQVFSRWHAIILRHLIEEKHYRPLDAINVINSLDYNNAVIRAHYMLQLSSIRLFKPKIELVQSETQNEEKDDSMTCCL